MTKQEEIREGIALRLHTRDRTWLRILDEINPRNCMWEELPQHFKKEYYTEVGLFEKYLHSQGVVIKVERETIYCDYADPMAYTKCFKEFCPFIKAGYVAAEPLIEEE